MIDLTRSDAIERLADLVATRVLERLGARSEQAYVGRQELSQLSGVSVATIDRMAAGGHWVKHRDGSKDWRETAVKLQAIRTDGRTLFDKAQSLAAIRAATSDELS